MLPKNRSGYKKILWYQVSFFARHASNMFHDIIKIL